MLKLRESINKYSARFDDAIRQASTDKVAVELLREKKRWLCKNDLFYLACLVGNEKIAQWKDLYQPFCDEVSLLTWRVVDLNLCKAPEGLLKIDEVTDDWKNDLGFYKRLFICYRTFFKTTVVTKVHSLQLLLNFPNIHLVLCHNKQENASDNLVSVKNLFLNTEIGRLFKNYVPGGKEWGNQSGFSVETRTDKGARTEENIEAVGVDTEVTGRHWMLAKKNDLVTEKSVTTEEQIKKTAKWDETFNLGLFDDPQCPLQDYEGTKYHYSDLYTDLVKDPSVKVVKIPVLKDLKKFLEGDDSQITHPQRFTREGIMLLRKDPWVFSCQMMLEPEAPENKRFVKEMIQCYNDLPETIKYVILVDPANEKKKRSDYTAMIIVGIGLANYYIVDMLRDKLGPNERINKALDFVERYRIKDVAWEKIGLNNDTFYLEEQRRKRKLKFTIHEIEAQNVSKVDRIRDILVPQYAEGKWLWPQKGKVIYYSQFEGKNVDMVDELEMEFLQFPNGKHDDMLDAKTFLTQMTVAKPVEKPEPETEELTFGKYVSMREERLNRYKNNPYKRLDFAGRT